MKEGEEHFEGQVAVKVIVVFGGQVLLVRGIDFNEAWDLPGGHLHKDEMPLQAAEREVQEELGLRVKLEPFNFAESFFHPGPQKDTLMLVYTARVSDSTFRMATDELLEVGWFGQERIKELPIYENCLHALDQYFTEEINSFTT